MFRLLLMLICMVCCITVGLAALVLPTLVIGPPTTSMRESATTVVSRISSALVYAYGDETQSREASTTVDLSDLLHRAEALGAWEAEAASAAREQWLAVVKRTFPHWFLETDGDLNLRAAVLDLTTIVAQLVQQRLDSEVPAPRAANRTISVSRQRVHRKKKGERKDMDVNESWGRGERVGSNSLSI